MFIPAAVAGLFLFKEDRKTEHRNTSLLVALTSGVALAILANVGNTSSVIGAAMGLIFATRFYTLQPSNDISEFFFSTITALIGAGMGGVIGALLKI